uniref:Uncharacterized protein n=1 Tax=Rousettus aegyptiacus TaxID=9407 RepID=A0A7J8H1M9_ROUAE|nr:hypothetical protein HJG63_011452 [Rousettus aegyptiacus]
MCTRTYTHVHNACLGDQVCSNLGKIVTHSRCKRRNPEGKWTVHCWGAGGGACGFSSCRRESSAPSVAVASCFRAPGAVPPPCTFACARAHTHTHTPVHVCTCMYAHVYTYNSPPNRVEHTLPVHMNHSLDIP